MRTFNIPASVFCVLVLSAATFAGFSPVEYFDFTGWDQTLIDSPAGQTFTDVYGDVDVTVESIGIFEEPTTASGSLLRMHHPTQNANSLRFEFSEPLRLVIESLTVDANEIQSIFTAGAETYMNTSGAEPTVTPAGSGIRIQGTGFGISPTGASFGETLTEKVSTLTLSYDTLAVNKYGYWQVGTLVPEPNSIALLGIGGLSFLMQFRRKRN